MKKFVVLILFLVSSFVSAQSLQNYVRLGKLTQTQIDGINVSNTNYVYTAYNTTTGREEINVGLGWVARFVGTGGSETDPVFQASEANNIDSQDISNLGNLTGTNSGDQDLSPYFRKDGSILATGGFNMNNHQIYGVSSLSVLNNFDIDWFGVTYNPSLSSYSIANTAPNGDVTILLRDTGAIEFRPSVGATIDNYLIDGAYDSAEDIPRKSDIDAALAGNSGASVPLLTEAEWATAYNALATQAEKDEFVAYIKKPRQVSSDYLTQDDFASQADIDAATSDKIIDAAGLDYALSRSFATPLTVTETTGDYTLVATDANDGNIVDATGVTTIPSGEFAEKQAIVIANLSVASGVASVVQGSGINLIGGNYGMPDFPSSVTVMRKDNATNPENWVFIGGFSLSGGGGSPAIPWATNQVNTTQSAGSLPVENEVEAVGDWISSRPADAIVTAHNDPNSGSFNIRATVTTAQDNKLQLPFDVVTGDTFTITGYLKSHTGTGARVRNFVNLTVNSGPTGYAIPTTYNFQTWEVTATADGTAAFNVDLGGFGAAVGDGVDADDFIIIKTN